MAGKGGARPGAGRPPKDKTVDKLDSSISDSSIAKLKKLGIDPITVLVKELKKLKGKEDFRSQNLRVRIAEKLLEYGYQKQPVSATGVEVGNVPVLTIVQKQEEKVVTPIKDEVLELSDANNQSAGNNAKTN